MEEMAENITVSTAPADSRFPTTNQAKHCFTRYNEYYKCIGEKGEDAEACVKYAKAFRSICPTDWVNKFEEQREEGTWPGKY
jgi:cytochrome c oxidase subunit 6b|mmetsp:Transcript_13898/g.43585  ORF Transcript_13898/g.43585 Transcript_13898/m.43585 type:complete len:82 (+) Transcript_13898:51-296(+)